MPQSSRSRQPLVGLVGHQTGQQLPCTASIHSQHLPGLDGVPTRLALSHAAPGSQVPLEGLQLAVEGLQLVVTAAATAAVAWLWTSQCVGQGRTFLIKLDKSTQARKLRASIES